MNIRDFFGPFLFTTALFFLLRSWWSPSERTSSDFTAPVSHAQLEPLYTSLDFENDIKYGKPREEKVSVITHYGEYVFSSYGAAVEKIVLYQGKDKRAFTLIDQSLSETPQYAPFLVGLEKNTPWLYNLESSKEDETTSVITFVAHSSEAVVRKIYTVDKTKHKLDIEVTVAPLSHEQTRIRIMWPAPLLNTSQDSIATQQVFRIDNTGSFKKYPLKKLNEQAGFFTPRFFGVESKYFVASFFQDHNEPVARAYYKMVNQHLYAFIESKVISEKTGFKYSFTIIPKDTAVLYSQIESLEKTFDYGFFGFFTKLMLTCLRFVNQFVHNYGWSIIIIIFLLKLLLLPLTYNSAHKMKQIKENERRFNYMQQKLQNDPVALAKLREDHVKENMSSLVTSQGPLMVQMPFIFGLSGVINNSLELCGAPFMLWMQDISMPDKYYILPAAFGVLLFINFINSSGLSFRKVIGFAALTLFLTGWFTHFSIAFLLFLFVNMAFHIGQNFIAERVK